MDDPVAAPRRAYSLFRVKAVNPDLRVISGMASTPTPDRVGDVMEPLGAKFDNPIPLLFHHDSRSPVGTVNLEAKEEGISFTASLPEIEDAGALKSRVDEAWQSIKAGLIKGVSIGFRSLTDGVELLRSGGIRFKAYEVFELSLVAVPANAEARIDTIKSFDVDRPAATGEVVDIPSTPPRAEGTRIVHTKRAVMQKSIAEQLKEFGATRQEKCDQMETIMSKAADEGRSLDNDESSSYDDLEKDITSLDEHIKRLKSLQTIQAAKAMPVEQATTVEKAAVVRGGEEPSVIRVTPRLEPGQEFARAVICKMSAWLSGGSSTALEQARHRYPDNPRIQQYLKATVAGGTTTDTTWAGPLVDQTNLVGEFIEFLRPQTIIGKFGTTVGGVAVPSLRRVPFNIRVVGQTSGGTGYWVGQGAPKPLTRYDFEATTLLWAKAAAIAVISEELARFSSPSAEMLVRDALAASIVERLDQDFVDPAKAVSANVSPASITNGIAALATAGTTADNARTDITTLLKTFIEGNQNMASTVIIMPNTLAMSLSMLVNSLGQPEFPGIDMNGGRLQGIPVVTSQYASFPSAGYGNIVIMLNASEIFLADDGQVTVDVSREASLQMLDNPTNNIDGTATTMVSMFQTNSLALRAERFINWARRRTQAVAWMDDVNWGSVGSPVG